MKQLNDYESLLDECAYCGTSPAPTKDHVIPRKFQSQGEEPWESPAVRACDPCNNRKAALDEQARNLLALHQSSRSNESANKLIENEIARSMRHLQENGRTSPTLELLKHMQPIQFEKTDGSFETLMAGKASRDVISPWLEFVVQGLSVALWEKRLVGIEYEIKAFEPQNFQLFLADRQPFEFVIPLGTHTKFSYDPLGMEPGYGQWVFQFYGGLGFAVLVAPQGTFQELDTDEVAEGGK